MAKLSTCRADRTRRVVLLLSAVLMATLLTTAFFGATRVKAAPNAVSWPPIGLKQVASGFSGPIDVESANDGTERLFVLEKKGIIRIIDHGVVLPTPFLDISGTVATCNECGILGIAFPPDFAHKGYFFINYTNKTSLVPGDTGDPDGANDTVIARYYVSDNPNVADTNSKENILVMNQPATNHNGGHILFGPDGYLYIGMGDGGGGGDTYHNGQDHGSRLGKILRIAVSGTATYTVPATNPFTATVGYRSEIWATGVRNPWRYGFDRTTGDFYLADVGQGTIEEVNYIAAANLGNGGFNFGWPIMEGDFCYKPNEAQTCNRTGLTLPVATYHHVDGNCSITGGFVYQSPLAGQAPVYLYADYCSGRLWGTQADGGNWASTQLRIFPFDVSSFGDDPAGNVYVVNQGGVIYRVDDSITNLSAHNDGPTPPNNATTFNATITPIIAGSEIRYTWDFGDGSAGNGATIAHTYNQTGLYTATVLAINETNSQTATTSVFVEAPPPPQAIAGLSAENDGPAEVNIVVGLTASVTAGSDISYTWDFGDGNGGSGKTTSHTYTEAGLYTATVLATNATNSMTAKTTVTVLTPSSPPPAIEGLTAENDGPAEVNSAIVFTATVSAGSGIVYSWDFGDGNAGSGKTTTHAYTDAGNLTAIVTATNATNSMTATTAVTVLSPATPPLAIEGLQAENDSPAEVNTAVGLSATVSAGSEIAYSWDYGDGNAGNGITTTHSYAHAGIYTATVVASNATNSMTATTTLYVGDAIVEVKDFEFDPITATIPAGGAVVWVLKGGNHSVTADDGSFEQPAGTDWAPFVHTFTVPISGSVASAGLTASGTMTIAYHCEVHDGMVGSVVVQAAPPPPPAVEGLHAENDSPATINTPVGFTATVTNGAEISYTWGFSDGNEGSGITTTHAYGHAGIYTATVVASNATNVETATTTVYVGDAVVSVEDDFYEPTPITVPVGSKVIWVLRGSNPHSVTADDGSFEQAEGSDWSPFVYTFTSEGVFAYHCTVHEGMAGRVIVSGRAPQAEMLLPTIGKNAVAADDQNIAK